MSGPVVSGGYPQLRERIADEVREAVLDAVRMAHRSLLGPEWDAELGVDEDGFDALYTHAADAVLDALRLSKQERTHWTLYNPREQAHRMSLIKGDGVWTIEDARERMAPYHHEGDGYEVIERTQVWWQTPTEMTTPLPEQSGSSSPTPSEEQA